MLLLDKSTSRVFLFFETGHILARKSSFVKRCSADIGIVKELIPFIGDPIYHTCIII